MSRLLLAAIRRVREAANEHHYAHTNPQSYAGGRALANERLQSAVDDRNAEAHAVRERIAAWALSDELGETREQALARVKAIPGREAPFLGYGSW